MLSVAVVGHGYIGSMIKSWLDALLYNATLYHVRHTDDVPYGCQWIVNAAGYTGVPNVDACEKNRDACVEGNVVYPLMLHRRNPNAQIVHIGSGCIYNGYKDGGWLETDPANFTLDTGGSFYSGCKALGQRLLEPYIESSGSYLLRIRLPFHHMPNPKNLLTKVENYTKLVDLGVNSMTNMTDLCRIVEMIVQDDPGPGVYNVCNTGAASLRDVASIMDIKKEWFTREEFAEATTAPRSNCTLNTDKIQQIYDMPDVFTSLERAIKYKE